MNRTIDRVKLIFLVIFAISCVIIWTYQALYVWPRNRCEKLGDWWDWHDRVCAVPMPIWRFTGRGIPQPETPPAPAPAQQASSSSTSGPTPPPAKPLNAAGPSKPAHPAAR